VLVDYIRVCEIPNRCPDIKVGDREETRFADISPCMLWEKKTRGRGGRILRTREEHGDDVEAGRSCQRSANFLAFPLYKLHWIWIYSPRGPRGEILYTGIRHTPLSVPTSLVAAGRRRRHAQGPGPAMLSFSILPARLRPSSSSQWINPSGPIGFILSASTDAIPLFSLFLHWPNMHVLSSSENDNHEKLCKLDFCLLITLTISYHLLESKLSQRHFE
jgi:hypothetical protein